MGENNVNMVDYFDTLAQSQAFPRLLLSYMLRNYEVCGTVVDMIEPSDFDSNMEKGIQMCIRCVKEHWEATMQLIPAVTLATALMQMNATDAMPLSSTELVHLLQDLQTIYNAPAEHTEGSFILEAISRFARDRRMAPIFDKLVGARGAPLSDGLDAIEDAVRKVSISGAKVVDLENFDDESMLMRKRDPTGVAIFDHLMGGGLHKGECIGVMAPTGGGKTTLAIELVASMAQHTKQAHSLVLPRDYGVVSVTCLEQL